MKKIRLTRECKTQTAHIVGEASHPKMCAPQGLIKSQHWTSHVTGNRVRRHRGVPLLSLALKFLNVGLWFIDAQSASQYRTEALYPPTHSSFFPGSPYLTHPSALHLFTLTMLHTQVNKMIQNWPSVSFHVA